MIYLVRHADAGDKATWPDADLRRPLSPRGWREAVDLAIRLENLPIDRIVTSPALRCAQTVRPLAARKRLPVDQCYLLGVGADPADVAACVGGGVCDRAVCARTVRSSRDSSRS